MIVAVLGGPRSGSSMVAGVLHRLGVPMGKRMLPADCWNQRGYYEDLLFLGLHRVMSFPRDDARRRALRLPVDRPAPPPALRRRYARAVAARCRQTVAWGVKDPRLLFLVDHLLDAARAAHEIDIRVVATRRPPVASIESLKAMFDMSHSDADEAVATYRRKQAEVAATYPGLLWHEVDYDAALDDPTAAVAALAEFVGRPKTVAALSFIDPGLRRHGALAPMPYSAAESVAAPV